jgi:endo-1,4-beta-xylanase
MLTIILSNPAIGQDMTLKQAFDGKFYMGAAMGRRHFQGMTPALLAHQFNAISPCNEFKWEPFNPKPDIFNHQSADQFIDLGTRHNMYIVGHVLFWHNQTPAQDQARDIPGRNRCRFLAERMADQRTK